MRDLFSRIERQKERAHERRHLTCEVCGHRSVDVVYQVEQEGETEEETIGMYQCQDGQACARRWQAERDAWYAAEHQMQDGPVDDNEIPF